jgi:hypothetical protein
MDRKTLRRRLVRLRFAEGKTRSWVAGEEVIVVLDLTMPHDQRREAVKQALRDARPRHQAA